ncbi:MAG TPA: HD domain-containing protein [Bacteroidia bacterium]|nr:HD domain-containing protein [Bacteroidia bacterium]
MKHDPPLPLPASLLARMDATPQNPRYHREGSVLAHTQFVVERCLAMRDQFDLDEDERLILYWAAVLHDVGKTVATVWQDNRWRSPGHEKAGLPFALEILLQHPEISAHNRQRILDLVRWHGFPLRFFQWQQSLDELKLLGTRTDLRLLAIFGLLDFHGRNCDDKVEVLAKMHHFQEVSVPQAEFEFGKYGELQAAFEDWNLRHKNAVWNAIKMKDVRLLEKLVRARQTDTQETRGQKATLVIGPPLSGKSTWIAAQYPENFTIHLAEHGIDNSLADNSYLLGRKMVEIKHLLRVYINRHHHLIIETRPLQDTIRRQLADILRDMPVELDYTVVETGLETLKLRNLASGVEMDDKTLETEYHQMELIHPWEAHKTTHVTGGDPGVV